MFGHRFFGGAFFGPHYWGPGTSTPVPPTPDERTPGAGKGKRRYVRLRNGETREIYSERDLQDVVRQLIAVEEPVKKPKRGPKKGKKTAKPGVLLQNFAAWDTLEAELSQLSGVIEERLIIDMILAILVRQAIKEDDEEVMLLLEMMT